MTLAQGHEHRGIQTKRSKKVVSSALLSLALTTGAIGASSAPAHAVEGNRVIVSDWGSYERVRALCFDKQRQYSSMRVRITQTCSWIGQDQHYRHGFAFYWTQA